MYMDREMMVGEMCCFSSLQPGKVLKEKAAAKIYFERNLYEDFCRDGNYIPYTVLSEISYYWQQCIVSCSFSSFPHIHTPHIPHVHHLHMNTMYPH